MATIQCFDGKFWCAEQDGRMVTDRVEAHGWEQFEVERKDGKLAFKSWLGTYVSVEPDGTVHARGPAFGPYEELTIVECGDEILFKTYHNTYLSARRDKKDALAAVTLRDDEIPNQGKWENFKAEGIAIVVPGG